MLLVLWFVYVVNPKRYADGSLTTIITARVTQARLVGGKTPDLEEHHDPPDLKDPLRKSSRNSHSLCLRNFKPRKPISAERNNDSNKNARFHLQIATRSSDRQPIHYSETTSSTIINAC
ncbi:hypothetical protein CDAR_171451 [Caerostris darwini]|uniref:Secreted protein n=1 Tax=Caerostris darwini TaxID=1538125 RepID=A0AAV4WLN4_9ARAC|nr:hypothetical protein CDAR_171451 [Caerostris darwini]